MNNIYDSENVIAEIYNPSMGDRKEVAVSDNTMEIEYAKENIKELIKTGVGAIETLARLAEMSESHKDYAVLASMLKTVSDLNSSIVELENKKTPAEKSITNNTVNNPNIYIGTTSDILSKLKMIDLEERTNQ